MSLADRWIVGRELLRVLTTVAADAIGDLTHQSLPLSQEPLVEEGRGLRVLLTADELAGGREAPWPDAIELVDQFAPSSNCQNSVLRLLRSNEGAGDHLPRSVFVKQPSASLSIRIFANLIGFWKIECAVCRNLSSRMPIETPHIHAVRERRSRFLLVMENLAERPGIRLHVNRELVDGINPESARLCLDALARLHAGFAELSEAERERALPRSLHPFRSPSLRPVMLAVNRLAAQPCHDRAGDLFDSELLDLYRLALSKWGAMERAWYREPLTLVHGDSHWGNFFETPDGVGMLDFQGAHFGSGVRDVQYFLVNSMTVPELAACERNLVEYYAKRVSEQGAPISFDNAWEQYRAFSFQTLMTAVVSLGLGSFSDSDDVMRVMLERSTAAVRRLDFEGWLADLPDA